MKENRLTDTTAAIQIIGNNALDIQQPSKQDYKQLLRKKILIGSCYLKLAQTPEKLDKLMTDLDNYLTRPSDRVLFDLPCNDLG